MRIGIDIRTLMDQNYSGVSYYTKNLISALLSIDKKNEYVLFYNSLSDVSDRIPEFNSQNVSIARRRYPNKLLNYGLFKLMNWPKMDRMLNCDLLFLPHINFEAHTRLKRSILTIHDLSFLRYPEFFSFRKNLWHWFICVKEMVVSFDTIIAISESTKNDIVELLGVEPKKISVIYSGIERIGGLQVNSDPYIKIPEKYLLCLSTIEPRKNIEAVITAYEYLRESNRCTNYKLVLAGSEGWKSNYIIKRARKSKYSKDIIFLGYINDYQKIKVYSKARILIFPSIYEGFGFPPLEAMTHGVPIISSNVSSLPEVLSTNAILINPLNVNEIKEAIKKVLTNNDFREKLILLGHQNTKKFSWQNVATQYLTIFNETY